MPSLPTPFGKYELVDKVASGGMAEVFRACTRGEAGFEKFLAIKRILPHLSRDTEFVVMLIDEAKIAVTLNHANVVQVYDLGKVEGIYFIAMEFVEGADLKAVLLKALQGGQPIPPALAVFLIMEVLKGLEYAHQKKVLSKDTHFALQIIHRDISPPNILLSYEGEVKIVDFGIAKANTRMMETAAGVLKGKFEYMSPEQAAGLELDQRTDIFSAGLCLFEAMTGVNPFSASADLQVIQKVRAARFPPASSLNSQIPPRLDLVINKALAREKGDRYSSANEFRNDLAHAAYESGLIATSPKLAAFMRELFREEISKGQHFVSGNSFPDSRANRSKSGPDNPYHRRPRSQGPQGPQGGNAPKQEEASPWEGRDNRTVLRMKVEPEPAPPSSKPGPRVPQQAQGRRPQVKDLAQGGHPPHKAVEDFDAASTFLAPPSKRPRRPAAGAPPPDLSADQTFLAPSKPAPKAQKPRAIQSLMHPDGPKAPSPPNQKPPPRPKAQVQQRRPTHHPPSERPPSERPPRNPAVESTFLPPPLDHNAPPPALADDGTDALETQREQLASPPSEPRRAVNRDASNRPLPIAPKLSHPEADLSEPPGASPTVTAYAPPPQAPLSKESQAAAPEISLFEPEMPGAYGTVQSPVHPRVEGGLPHYETTAPPPPQPVAGSPRAQSRRPTLLAFGGGLLLGLLLGGGLGTFFAGGETEAPKEDAQSGVGEVIITAQPGALTLVDGQSHGTEYPLRLALPSLDTHSVEISLEGFETIRHDVALDPGGITLIDVRFDKGQPLEELED